MARPDSRNPNELRPCEITVGFVGTADGSCLIRCGGTRVICTASVEESVPPFLKGKNVGWLTAEYNMLPASTGRRKARDGIKKDGRGVEIGRLIGRVAAHAAQKKSRALCLLHVRQARRGFETERKVNLRHETAGRPQADKRADPGHPRHHHRHFLRRGGDRHRQIGAGAPRE